MTMLRWTKALRHGILAALAGPSDLILAAYEKPLTYRKFSVDDAWREVGDYLEQGIRHFERHESRESDGTDWRR